MTRKRKDYTAELVRLRTGREVPDLLRELYIDERRSQHQIAAALGVERHHIVYWLRKYDINLEDRRPIQIETVA